MLNLFLFLPQGVGGKERRRDQSAEQSGCQLGRGQTGKGQQQQKRQQQ